MLIVNDIIRGVISRMAFGGQGILQHEGLVIFVPYTAINDHVKVRVTKVKKNFAEAKLLEVIKPSKDRVQPFCPYFGTCGGCQLQHLSYSAQLKHKEQTVKDALLRIGQAAIPDINIVPAQQQWAYRRHIRFNLRNNEAGYIANDYSLLPVKTCPIFSEDNELLSQVHQLVSSLQSIPQSGQMTILKERICSLNFEKKIPENYKEASTSFWKGIQWSDPNTTKTIGSVNSILTIESLQFHYSPEVFMQNHPEQSLKIYLAIRDYIVKIGAKSVLDLYCGIGITSLLLAKEGIATLGIEQNKIAIDFARQNKLQAKFIHGNVENLLPNLQFKADVIVVNPPRIGLHPNVLKTIGKIKPKTLIYVSCMPSTLARDIKKLREFGYTISSCTPYDMFPQTAHVETVIIASAAP